MVHIRVCAWKRGGGGDHLGTHGAVKYSRACRRQHKASAAPANMRHSTDAPCGALMHTVAGAVTAIVVCASELRCGVFVASNGAPVPMSLSWWLQANGGAVAGCSIHVSVVAVMVIASKQRCDCWLHRQRCWCRCCGE